MPKQREPLKAIGYWWETPLPIGDGLPEPQDLVCFNWRRDERMQVVAYLRSGKTAVRWRGFALCRLCAERTPLGARDLTDGEWVWPERLEHYVEEHGVCLPTEFIESMRRHKWMVLIPPKKARWSGQAYDFSSWIAWAAEVKATPLVEETR